MNNTYTHIPTNAEVLGKIRFSIPSYISGKRLIHTYSVEKKALELAKIFFPILGIDEKYYSDISASALLHDMTKYLSLEEHKKIYEEYGIEAGISDLKNTAVLHSRTGAYAAKRDFDVNDTVFSAIYCHTTGKENMNIFDKIIFIADFIEETRTHESCVFARNFFHQNIIKNDDKIKTLDMTIIMSLDSTLSYLLKQGEVIDLETIKARNFLLAEYALQNQHTGE